MPNLSVKLNESTRQRLQQAAERQSTTPHALMIRAIQTELAHSEAQEAFVARALAAREGVVASGRAIDGEAFAEHLRRRVRGIPSQRPAPAPLESLLPA